MHYIIIKGEGHEIMQAIHQLEIAVNEKTNDGYKPIGNLILTDFVKPDEKNHSHKINKVIFLQPMILEKYSKDPLPMTKG